MLMGKLLLKCRLVKRTKVSFNRQFQHHFKAGIRNVFGNIRLCCGLKGTQTGIYDSLVR